MLLEAILGIIAISVVFCCCTLCCYVVFQYLFNEEKSDVEEDSDTSFKHYYDPLPLRTPSPPDTIFKKTPYTFKLQNGNGIYPSGVHAVINPAVLQYPIGHVQDQQRIQAPHSKQPTVQFKSRKDNDLNKQQRPYQSQSHSNVISRRHSHSRSPSPSPRSRTKNVWSTNTEFQNPNNYYQSHHHHHQQRHHYPQQPPPEQYQYQEEFQRHYVQLTQEHYPIQQKHIRFTGHQRENTEQQHQHNHEHQQNQSQSQYEPFMASSHATNVYTQHQTKHHQQQEHHNHNHSPHRKNSKGHHHKSKRHKEAVT